MDESLSQLTFELLVPPSAPEGPGWKQKARDQAVTTLPDLHPKAAIGRPGFAEDPCSGPKAWASERWLHPHTENTRRPSLHGAMPHPPASWQLLVIHRDVPRSSRLTPSRGQHSPLEYLLRLQPTNRSPLAGFPVGSRASQRAETRGSRVIGDCDSLTHTEARICVLPSPISPVASL